MDVSRPRERPQRVMTGNNRVEAVPSVRVGSEATTKAKCFGIVRIAPSPQVRVKPPRICLPHIEHGASDRAARGQDGDDAGHQQRVARLLCRAETFPKGRAWAIKRTATVICSWNTWDQQSATSSEEPLTETPVQPP